MVNKMKCSVETCLEEKGEGDRLFCELCRQRWRDVVYINNYDSITHISIINKVLASFTSSGI